ncbi:MAG: site-specific integrase [Actinomycetota bacterium]|nr:site-specific integrase [Actinomycetota bacterium]
MIEKKATKSGEPRYEVRVRGTDGTERSKTFRIKKEAERYERAQQTAVAGGVWIDPRAGRVTLAAWSAEWQRTVVHLSPSTQRIYEANLRLHVMPELGEMELSKLTPSMLRAWLSGVSTKTRKSGRKLAGGSVSQAYRTLNRVLSAAVDDELIGRNPLRGVRPPQVKTKTMKFLSHDEVAALAAVIDERYRALVLVASYCGLRAGELMALRRPNVDLLHRSIAVVEQVHAGGGHHHVSPPKSAAGRRSVAVPSIVVESLEIHLGEFAEAGSAGLVFPAPSGGFMRPENFRRRVWTPATLAAGVAPLRLHDLRHTCASLAIAAGADVKVLQRMLGHASAALTLDRYGHLMPGQAELIADRLDAMARASAPAPLADVVALGDTNR